MKKISFIILLCLYFLFLSSKAYTDEDISCINIFEKMIQDSSFEKYHSPKGQLKIDLYDISLENNSIIFKLYDEAYSSERNLFISGWVKYNYNQRQIYDISYDELNPIMLTFDHRLEKKFRNCLSEKNVKISDLVTRE
ncbi:hypothetical protein RHO12_11535 [Orbus sturtevantii]|uniref:hypothetical protein n=1 Tax=Orbus sturtevantii TaxID=3074109 RepID=UPI00370D18BA